jgi:phosphatidate cytidylyltransferase
MKQRVISAVFFVIAMLGGIFGGYFPFLVLFGVITAGSAWELMKLVFGLHNDHLFARKMIGTVLATVPFVLTGLHFLYPNFSLLADHTQPWLFTVILFFPFYILWMMELLLASEKPFTNMGHFLLGLVYVGIPLALLIDIAMVDDQYTPLRVFGILGLNWINDTFAYFTGSLIGKTPFFPRISPKKTWEGTLGGVGGTVIIAWGISYFLHVYTPSEWVAIAASVAIFGTVGDLIESMLKRSVGVKDSGNIMPGHGGFLDRFDSFVFLLPFVWIVLRLF